MRNISNTIQKIRNFLNQPFARYGLLFFIVTALFAVIIVLVMNANHIEVEPSLTINNFQEVLPNMPKNSRTIVEQKLYAQVKKSLKDNEKMPTSGALIRKESLYSFDVGGTLFSGDFIVDIDSVHQSYIIKYFYGGLDGEGEIESSAAVEFYCLTSQDKELYQDFECRKNNLALTDFTHDTPIVYLLPKNFSNQRYSLSYAPSTTSSSGYAVVIEFDPPEAVYLSGNLEDFVDEKMILIRSWLKENNMDPDDYEFIIKYKIVR